jgi:hypothetical protein
MYGALHFGHASGLTNKLNSRRGVEVLQPKLSTVDAANRQYPKGDSAIKTISDGDDTTPYGVVVSAAPH